MTISVECPGCGKRYRVDDDRAGQTLDCRECGEEVEIPGGRRRKGEGAARKSGKSKKKSDSGVNPVMIGVGVGGVLVVAGVIVAFAMRRPAEPAPVPVPPAQNGIAANPAGGPPATPNAAHIAPVTPNPAPNGNPAPNPNPNPAANPPVAENPPVLKAAGNGFKGAGQAAAGAKFQFTAVNWKARPDAGPNADPVDSSAKFQVKLKGGFLGDDSVIYPVTASPFALVSEADGKGSRDVFNLATGKKAGSLKGQNISGGNVALSPDGKYVGWFRFEGSSGIVEVWDVPGKKSLGGIAVDPKKFNMALLAMPSPTRMVAFSDVNRALLSWKLPSGDLEREQVLGEKCRPADRFSFSPGGRYAAFVSDYLAKWITVYDFDTGEISEIQFPNRPGNELLGISFSPDGKTLALAFDGDTPSYAERILLINTADGALAESIILEEGVKKEHNLHGKGTSLQWFPDGKHLLLHGIAVIDRSAGKVVYSLGKPGFDSGSLKNRRVLGNGLLADWQGSRQESAIKPLTFSAEDIARSTAVVEAGGLMVDSKLPPLTRFEASSAEDLSSDRSQGWQASADAAAAATKLLESPLPLKGSGQVRDARYSQAVAGLAFLRTAEGEDPNDVKNRRPETRFRVTPKANIVTQLIPKAIHCRKNGIDVYDLAKRDLQRRIDIDFSCDLMAASPGGTRIAVAPHDGEGRLDVYSVADGKHVAACRPFQSEEKTDQRLIQKAIFLDEDHLAAMNFDDRLLVWKLPECTPLYEIREVVSPVLSPGGKYLVVALEDVVSFRDPRTGKSVGDLTMEGPVRALAIHPQGERMAVVCSVRKGTYLYEVDVKSGRASEAIPLPIDVVNCQWAGDGYLLLNRTALLDLKQKTVAWTYDTPDDTALAAATPPDARHWLVAKAARGAAVQIAAIELPDPAAVKRLAGANLEPKMVVQPGGAVTVMPKIPERPDRPGFQAEALGFLNTAVERSGVKDLPGQPVKLAVNVELKMGNVVPVRFFGGGGQQEAQLQEKTLEITVAYDFNGAVLWKTSNTIANLGTFVRVPSVETAQKAIDDQMWDRARGFFDALQLPAYVFSQESVYGLGSSLLSGEGATAKSK